ncbi:MAG TPA: efflux RND transporter periplasmic adaptor subunit [Candidatus Krumholzibacteria bacterium]|nr:efflux RND transporter periplasmic adaptor subunit [Candidatus Krumholzibacteria bacterium]
MTRTPSPRLHPCVPPLPAAVLAVGLALLLQGCGGEADVAKGSGPGTLIPAVEAVQTRAGTLPLTQRLSGVVRAVGQVDVHPEITAVVAEVLVRDGDAVRAGQPLVRLRDADFRTRLTQAEAALRIAEAQQRRAEALAREARADLARLRTLADGELASAAELEAAQAAAETAEADVELAAARADQSRAAAAEARADLARTVVRAPGDGHVGNRDAEPGLLAAPSTRLLTVGRLDSVRVQVILTDRMLADVDVGQRTEILLPGTALEAPLARISPFLHPVSHTTEAEVDLANPDLRLKPGMFVAVDVFTGESQRATLVPLSAVYEHPVLAQTGVYVAAEDLPPAGAETAGADGALLGPVTFRFVPVEIVAEGRMEAAVRPLPADAWVVSLGQNLLTAQEAQARVRPVDRARVDRLQTLQREDLMRALNERRAAADAAGTVTP